MSSFTFRHGVTTGILGCLFLITTLLLAIALAKKISANKSHLLILTFVSFFAGLVIFWSTKPGDSDTWWVGAAAGFIICVAIVLPPTTYVTYKLLHKTSNAPKLAL
jgi:hypothetical protein